jgi:hypothetical protein
MKIATEADRVTVTVEYHPDFPKRARNFGGRWDAAAKTWSFDPRDRDRVLALLRDVYGTDGTAPSTDLVTLRVTVPVGKTWYSPRRESLFCAGRLVARAYGRDSGARLGPDVVLLEGHARSNGSRASWYAEIKGPAVVEIRDVPRAAALRSLDDLRRDDLVPEIVGELGTARATDVVVPLHA